MNDPDTREVLMPATPARLRCLVAGAVLLLIAAPAAAAPPFAVLSKVEDGNTNLFLWEAPFSLYRWLLFAVGAGVAWLLAFNVLMLSALALDNAKPPRPREAFARSAGWFVLFTAVAFVVSFAVAANDLYSRPWVKWFPSPLTPLNYHLPWIAVLILGLALMFLVRYVFRR